MLKIFERRKHVCVCNGGQMTSSWMLKMSVLGKKMVMFVTGENLELMEKQFETRKRTEPNREHLDGRKLEAELAAVHR